MESSPLLFGVSALVGICLFALASATEGGWHAGRLGAVERAGVALLALACAAGAVYGVAVTVMRLLELPTLGTAPSHSTFPLAGTAFALFALTLMVVVLPLDRGDGGHRLVWRAAIATATLGLLGAAGSAVADAVPEDAGCSTFTFEPSRWRVEHAAGGEASSRMAEAIDRCDTIPAGTSRARVKALLGRPDSGTRDSWSWSVGESDGWTYEALDDRVRRRQLRHARRLLQGRRLTISAAAAPAAARRCAARTAPSRC